MRRLALVIVMLMAACGPGSTPFQIELELQRGDAYTCSSDRCDNIAMTCDVAMLIRIVDATNEGVAYAQNCQYIEANGDLCQVGTIDLEPADIPNRPVRIQVAVWSLDDIEAFNPALRTANECPSMTFEAISGEPATQPSPALWGQTYFEVGSSSVASVMLNCADIGSLDTEACQGTGRVHVVADVLDFGNLGPVAAAIDPSVWAGEPQPTQPTGASFNDTTRNELQESIQGRWEGNRPAGFVSTACVETIGRFLQAASTLDCRPVDAADVADGTIELEGIYISNSTIDQIEEVVGSLPTEGVVIGKVVDGEVTPVEGAVVTTTDDGSIVYLSSDLSAIVPDMTSSSGVFVSKDVDYFDAQTGAPTTWTATVGDATSTGTAIGGVVRNHVTIVILQMP